MIPETADIPLWRARWFGWMVVVLVGCGIAAFVLPPVWGVIYAARSVLLPVVIAFTLAYIFNPIVTFLQRRVRLPRWLGTAGVMLALLGAGAGAALLIVPPLAEQAGILWTNLSEEYPRKLMAQLERLAASQTATPMGRWLTEFDTDARLAQAAEAIRQLDWRRIGQLVVSWLDVGVGVAGAAVSFTGYLGMAALVTGFCFFFFSWKFVEICAWFVPLIPSNVRERTLEVVGQMDRSVAAFIRGRLIQAAAMAVVMSVGWWIAGVPGFLLLGLAGGLLNLVPFAAVVACLAAVGLKLIDDLSGASGGTSGVAVSGGVSSGGLSSGVTWWTVAGPMLVYLVAQALDGWVVEPIVQGKATDLDPVTVLLVVMLGGATAGLLGMLLAIPVAACVKILAREVVLPRLRSWAANVR